MRVIAGCYHGQRLRTPTGCGTRPILDRVKVALFDWLGAQLAQPGSLPPLNVLDMFCGGGSLGIEALSRGAAFCVFVEADRQAFQCLRENLDRLRTGPLARIFNCPAEIVETRPPGNRAFGLVFLDPPYRLSDDVTRASVMGRVTARLGAEIPVEPDAIAIWRHHARCILPEVLPGGWASSRRRTWGRMAITTFERIPQVPS
ncbi:MAG: RsmD family RNA methyltransferase [Phycisphaerae bacterium]|nr:RsmD family RNA methyltransferase [Phycisphaerae bacterium]